MKPRTIAAAGCAATSAALLMTGFAPPGTAANWVSTATKAIPLAHATSLGAAPGSTPLRLTVGLTPRNRAGLDSLLRAQATPGTAQYEQYLTPAQFTSRFAATSATATAVADYLRNQGMSGVTVAGNRLQITADATVAQADRAFNTSISRFSQFGATILSNTKAAQVPASLGSAVSAVVGLSSLGASFSTPELPSLSGFYPKEFTKIYDGTSTGAGAGISVAVIAEGNVSQTVTDLRTAETAQGLPKTPVTLVPTGIASTDTAGVDEWDLDTQTSTGVATKVSRLYMYVATSLTDADLARSVNAFAVQDKAKAGSASLGECDVLPYLDGSMTVDDMAFAEAAVQGQTFFASTGDTGSSCAVEPTNGVPGSGPTDTEYPASSPYVVGVGGTTLLATAADAYQNEIAWNAGGGGVSPVENSGYWQTGVVPTAEAAARGLPDIAFDADPDSGANIYVSGSPETIGGTSLSSPMALGMWARVQSDHGGKLGFAAPKLYGIYAAAQTTPPVPPNPVPASFHDVIAGVNGAYSATLGWDYTTGLGSFDLAKLDAAIK